MVPTMMVTQYANEHPERPGHFAGTVNDRDDRLICLHPSHTHRADAFHCAFDAVFKGATTQSGPQRIVAWDREESDMCEVGTPGCCLHHRNGPLFDEGCDCW